MMYPLLWAVNWHAIIFMNKVKIYILDKGGFIYHTYTDSIVTDIKLNEDTIVMKYIYTRT